MRREHLCAILAVGALVFPSAAVGQSAGDNQYQDPFTPQAPQGGSKPRQSAGKPSPVAQPQTGQPATPVVPGEAAGTFSSVDPAETAVATATGEQLPRTGMPVEPMLALGLLMTGSGVALLLAPAARRRP
jgi:hypothetical protein